MKSGEFAPACPKLEAAVKLYRGSGVLLNLADCYEHVGRTASAWTEFGEAASLAVLAGRQDDESEARRRQAALEPRLAHLVVDVKGPAPTLSLSWDGKELLPAAWHTRIPVDPGPHTLAATAPGRAAWSASVNVASEATETVEVPELLPLPPPSHEADKARVPGPPTYWTRRRELGIGVASGGVLVLGAAGVLGLVASSEFSRANGEAGSARVHDSGTAVTEGNVATVVAAVGAAATAIGLVVWLTARSTPTPVTAQPFVIGGVF